MKGRILFLGVTILLLVAGAVMAWQLAAPVPVKSADAETFVRANQLFANGNYAAADGLYRQLLADGIENGDVYYNLGATYAAMGEPDRAAEMTARARELSPRDVSEGAGPPANFLPLTANETALFALGALYFSALLFVLLRSRQVSKNAASV